MSEPICRLPDDWHITPSATPLAELVDWWAAFLGVAEPWKTTRGKGIKVGILDTGVDQSHEDLEGAVVAVKDFSRSRVGASDLAGHGTHCAGLVGARANDVGVRGIAPECELVIAKVLGDNGAGGEPDIVAGFDWAASQGCDIISMSLGGTQAMPSLSQSIANFCRQPHRFVFAAAGNSGRPNGVNWPGKDPNAIAIGAHDKQGLPTRFTSRGPEVAVLGPGYEILSTIPGGYGAMSGTSMATPIVAGLFALCLAKHLDGKQHHTGLETRSDVVAHLKRACVPVGQTGNGLGVIDASKLFAGITEPEEETKQIEIELPFVGRIIMHVPAKAGDMFSVSR